MISVIVDGILLVALVATTVRMLTMHRELRQLGSYHEDYQRIFDQTALALDGIEVSIQEINVKSAQLLNALGSRMDDARELIAEIDGLTREAKRQQSVLRAELKELSRATAVMGDTKRYQTARDDHDLFVEDAASDPALPQEGDSRATAAAAARCQPTIHRGTVIDPTPTRVHRIESSMQSPFRTVSMTQKDKM